MESTKAFYDLCIQDKCFNSGNFLLTAKQLVEFGYRTVAINQTINDIQLEPSKKKKKGENRETNAIVPVPITIQCRKGFENLKILNRLTVIFSDKNSINKVMQSENFKKYDIFAVIPKTLEVLQFVCDSVDADVISFDPSDGKLFRFSRKLFDVLANKGTFFELMYFPAIRDSTSRRNIISRAHLYHQFGKSRNIIITSGASNHLSLRGPYDIINLGLIFGLSEEQSKCAISSACLDLVNRAIGRRMGKALILVTFRKEQNEEEMQVDSDEPVQKKSKVHEDDSIIVLSDN